MQPEFGFLDPLATLNWRKCSKLPLAMQDAQAVWLKDKLYVGGGVAIGNRTHDARLYIYTPLTDEWSMIKTPVCWFAVITYQSLLVIVGGEELNTKLITNKLWTWVVDNAQWRETIPHMTFKRSCPSAVAHTCNILVAGGQTAAFTSVDTVEVYNGAHWATAQSLPIPCCLMKSTVFNGHWYLIGGDRQGTKVFCASLFLLVASCQSSKHPLPSVWKRLSDVPYQYSSLVVLKSQLIAVGGYPQTSSICAYSPHTESWIHVWSMPVELSKACTAVLPSGKLMVIGGQSCDIHVFLYCVHQATLKGMCTNRQL